MQLSLNQKIFAELFSEFPKSTKDVEYLGPEDKPQMLFLSEIIDWKKPGYLNA